MPEPRLISLRVPAVNMGPALAERDRRDPRPPVQAFPVRARRVPPPVRNLPRRSGY